MLILYLSALENEAERMKIAELYYEYEPLMFRYALNFLKKTEKAQDAVHDAFESIIKHKEKYLALKEKNLRALIVIIIKSKCIDIMRKEQKIITLEAADIEISLPRVQSSEDVLIKEHRNERVRQIIKMLDEESKTIFEMKYVFNMSYKEIAKKLNMIPKQIDNKLVKIKSKLRKLLYESEG